MAEVAVYIHRGVLYITDLGFHRLAIGQAGNGGRILWITGIGLPICR